MFRIISAVSWPGTTISTIETTRNASIPGRYREAIQRPSVRRSAGVIPVAFPSGIVVVCTASCVDQPGLRLDLRARVEAGSRPAATSTPGCVGFIEWHGAQRACTIACTAANGGAGPAAAGESSPAGSAIAIARTPTAAEAGIHQAFRPRWRRLK